MIRSRNRGSLTRAAVMLAVGLTVAACGADAAPASPASPSTVAGRSDAMADVLAFKGGNTRTGVMPGPGPAGRPEVMWEFPLDDRPETEPLVVDGTVIVVTAGGDLIGVDAATGAKVFGWDLTAGVRSAGAAADDGTLYVVTEDGMLRAISLADGTARWPAVPGFDSKGAVAVVDGLVVAGGGEELVAVNAGDGEVKWRVQAEASMRVAVDGGFAYTTSDNSATMTVVDIAKGESVQTYEIGGADVGSTGLDAEGFVVGYRDVAGGENGVVTYSPDGSLLWRRPSNDRARNQVTSFTDDHVFVFTETPAAVEVMNRSDGDRTFFKKYEGDLIGGGAIADDVAYLVSATDGLIAVDASGKERWRVPLGDARTDTRLVVTGGLVIASTPTENGAGRVIALADPSDPRLLALRAHPVATPTPAPSPTAAPAPIFEVVGAPQVLEGDVFPMDPALGPDGTLYMVDPHSNRILVRAQDGTLTWWGAPGTGDGQFNFTGPTQHDAAGGVAVSPDGTLIAVGDGGNGRVQLFDGQRNFPRSIGRRGRGDGQFVNPCCVTFDAQNRIWVVDVARMDGQVFDSNGEFLFRFAEKGRGEGQLARPGAAFIREDTGEVYVPDFGNRRVSVFDETGTWLRHYGSLPEEGLTLDEVNNVEVDAAGQMYVVDTTNRIFILSPEGHPLGMIPPVLPDGIGQVEPGFTLDKQGRVYLTDLRMPRRIIQLQLLPPIWPPPG